MRVIVCGSRTFQDKEYIFNVLDTFKDQITGIISGRAKGADDISIDWAINNSIKYYSFIANWEKYGKSAGMIRNKQMFSELSKDTQGMLIAFWDGESVGTKNMINLCKNNPNIIIKVIDINNKKG